MDPNKEYQISSLGSVLIIRDTLGKSLPVSNLSHLIYKVGIILEPSLTDLL